jgi:multimeric flavodoxin WrbA
MKLLGITAGRKYGNSEILMKEALMAAEKEYGAETAWFNLHDAKILPCDGCEACTMRVAMKHEPPQCVYKGKDDMDKIMDELAYADGLIVSIPSFCLQPHGLWRIFTDRWLPYEWALQKQAGLVEKAPDRVAGLITVGGSTQNWMTLTLASLNISMFMQSIKVVDMMMATGCARPGHVVLKPEFLEKARKLGLNVAKSCTIDYDKVEYLGEEKGWCPVCHHNLMLKGKPHWDGTYFKYECAMKIIADRYHVVRQVMWAFENVRKAEQVKFYDSRRKYFKRNRRVLLKKPENLTEEETDQIESMLKISERLRQAYFLKNEFHKLMDCKSREDAGNNLESGT